MTEGRLIRGVFTGLGDVYARNIAHSMAGLLGKHDGRYQAPIYLGTGRGSGPMTREWLAVATVDASLR